MADYKTIKNKGCGELTEKRSRFIGYVCPVTSVGEAESFIAEIRKKHYDAKHNVYVYVLKNGCQKKFSDDGEPQGTAAAPILDIIEKSGLCDVCVVVTRYFGGVLLGTGGLVRAYSNAASLAIESGTVVTMSLCEVFQTVTDYNFHGRLQTLIGSAGGIITDTQFTNSVKTVFYVKQENAKALADKIFDASKGQFTAVKTGEKYEETKNL